MGKFRIVLFQPTTILLLCVKKKVGILIKHFFLNHKLQNSFSVSQTSDLQAKQGKEFFNLFLDHLKSQFACFANE